MWLLINYKGIISIYFSISWNIEENKIEIFTDSGRLCNPYYYINQDKKKLIIGTKEIIEKIKKNEFIWENMVTGFNVKSLSNFDINNCNIYEINELYGDKPFDVLQNKQSIIDYLDTSEKEGALICMDSDLIDQNNYTHLEIDASTMLGVMGNQIIFPENNPLPRNLFSCGQSKQAISVYHTNYLNRFDKMGVVLNYGQLPLIKLLTHAVLMQFVRACSQ